MTDTKRLSKLLVLLILCQAANVEPYPGGAPDFVCGSMVPGHGNDIQQSTSPYNILPNTTESFGGGRLAVKIESNSDTFKGFLIQAKDSEGNPRGTFYTRNHKTLNCGEGTSNAATHTSSADKNVVTLEWEAPINFGGDVIFTATVVKELVIYWTEIQSRRVTIQKRSAIPEDSSNKQTTKPVTTMAKVSPSLQSAVTNIYDGCGISKTCYGISKNCAQKKDCEFMVTYTDAGNGKFEFELIGKKTHDRRYVAVGLSIDDSMGSDSVVVCNNELGVIRIYHTWNDGKSNRRVNNENRGLTNLQTGEIDGVTYCRFYRDAVTKIEGKTFDLAEERFHILLSQGPVTSDGNLLFHTTKVVSKRHVDLGETSHLKARDTRLFRAIHGSLMIGAWVCAASCGILFARYYKKTWRAYKCCNIDQWFHFHRIFMISAWCLTMAAFALIVYELKTFRQTTHSIIGVVSVGLCFIQPFMAAFRPAPDGKHRGIFNWAHWLVGNSAQILGITAIFFGIELFMHDEGNWLKEFAWYVIIAFIAFHCLTHVVLSIAQCVSDRKPNDVGDVFPLKDFSGSRVALQPEDKTKDSPLACFRKFILAIYLIVNWCVTILLILIVAFRRETIEEQLDEWNIPAFWEDD